MIKRTLYVWQTDMEKIVTGICLPMGMILMCLLMLTGSVYQSETGASWNHITIFFEFKRQTIQGMFSAYEICMSNNSGLYVYAPLCVMLPLIPVLVMERQGGSRRYQIMRVGKKAFAIGKLLTALLTGGITLAGGFLLYCAYVVIMFSQGDIPLTIGTALYEAMYYFIYGAVLTSIGYIIGIFVKNVYLVYCIPFILNYLWEMSLSSRAIVEKSKTMKVIYSSLRSLTAMNLRWVSMETKLWFGVVHIIVIVSAVLLFIYYLNKKADCGV